MRDPARIPRILEALRVEWEKSPDLRPGQLIVNATPDERATWDPKDVTLFYREDEALVEDVRAFMAPRAKEK